MPEATRTLPAIIPMIAYEDPAAALEWLSHAFGFREREESRYTEPDGRITHAEMEVGGGMIMLANPTPDYQGPRHHAEICAQARKWSAVPYIIDGFYVHVEDVEAHFRQARDAGAEILSEPQDQHGERSYRVADLEGHRWMFAGPAVT